MNKKLEVIIMSIILSYTKDEKMREALENWSQHLKPVLTARYHLMETWVKYSAQPEYYIKKTYQYHYDILNFYTKNLPWLLENLHSFKEEVTLSDSTILQMKEVIAEAVVLKKMFILQRRRWYAGLKKRKLTDPDFKIYSKEFYDEIYEKSCGKKVNVKDGFFNAFFKVPEDEIIRECEEDNI